MGNYLLGFDQVRQAKNLLIVLSSIDIKRLYEQVMLCYSYAIANSHNLYRAAVTLYFSKSPLYISLWIYSIFQKSIVSV